MNFYLARQPIFDKTETVIGYEIIYRSSLYSTGDNDIIYREATSRLLLNSYLDVGMDTLLGGHIAFINFDYDLVMRESPFFLNRGSTIIQVSTTIEPDEAFIDKLTQFKEDGYMIALTDYVSEYPHRELVRMADIIQVNVEHTFATDLKMMMIEFKHSDHILLAKNIDTTAQYDLCVEAGFDLFEGYYFCQPTLTEGRMLQPSNYNNMEILKLANTPEPDVKLISKKIEEDVQLTVKLLRLVNSSHYFMNKISSVQHALAMIGVDSLKNWLNLALMDAFLGRQTPEIIKLSMFRMRLMETVGLESHLRKDIETLKLIGILSVLDVLLDKTMLEVVNPLPIDNKLKMTLLGRKTQYSDLYRLVLDYEKGDFNKAYRAAMSARFNLDKLPELYAEAIRWSDDIYEQIYPSPSFTADDLFKREETGDSA